MFYFNYSFVLIKIKQNEQRAINLGVRCTAAASGGGRTNRVIVASNIQMAETINVSAEHVFSCLDLLMPLTDCKTIIRALLLGQMYYLGYKTCAGL